jgi:hypothetical protein
MKEHPGLEAALEISEAAVDQIGDNGFLTDVPVVGVAFKLCKVVAGVRERIYLSKLKAFLTELDAIPRDQQHEMLTSLLSDSAERQKVGERLLMLLEQVTDFDKPSIMAVFFIAYLHKAIDIAFLLRAWDAISAAYVGDLKLILGFAGEPAVGGGNSHLEYLLRSGLTTFRGGVLISSIGTIEYSVSDFGNRFIAVYNKFKAA